MELPYEEDECHSGKQHKYFVNELNNILIVQACFLTQSVKEGEAGKSKCHERPCSNTNFSSIFTVMKSLYKVYSTFF